MQSAFAAHAVPTWAQPGSSTAPQHGFKRHKSTGGMTVTKYPHPSAYAPPSNQYNPYAGWIQPPQHFAQPGYAVQQWTQVYPQYSAAAYQHFPAQQYNSHAAQYGSSAANPAFHSEYQPHAATINHEPHATQAQYSPSNSWPTPYFDQHARSQSTDDRTMHQEQNDQQYFEFSAGNGPVHEADLPEDAEEYCEFTRSCSFAAREADVEKEFSLGLIICKTALPSNTALPATWLEANPDPSQPVVAIPYDADKCPSRYHSEPLIEATLQPVRSSECWNEVKDDLIFKHFPQYSLAVTTVARLRDEFVDRADPTWMSDKHSPIHDIIPPHKRSPVQSGSGKKRIFSQTEHADQQDQNKRYRPENRRGSSYRPNARHADSNDRHRHTSQEGRLPRHSTNGHPKMSYPSANAKPRSKIFNNGRLNPTRDEIFHSMATNDASQVLFDSKSGANVPVSPPVAEQASNLTIPPASTTKNKNLATQPASGASTRHETKTLSSDVDVTLQVASTDAASEAQAKSGNATLPSALAKSEHENAPSAAVPAQPSKTENGLLQPIDNQAKHETGSDKTVEVESKHESAWTRRAREYQAAGKRDFDQVDAEFDYTMPTQVSNQQSKRQR